MDQVIVYEDILKLWWSFGIEDSKTLDAYNLVSEKSDGQNVGESSTAIRCITRKVVFVNP